MNDEHVYTYSQKCDLNSECDMFFSCIGAFNKKWSDQPLEYFILVCSSDEHEHSNDESTRGIVRTITKNFKSELN